MINNDILRRLRYTFSLNDAQMMALASTKEQTIPRTTISNWLKKEEDDDYQSCSDHQMAIFLNGLITLKRGKKEGATPVAEKRLTNNIIFMKLKIALNLQADDVLAILALSELVISKHELSAFFRKTTHKHYRECKDQVLRNFLQGLQKQYHPTTPIPPEQTLSSIWGNKKPT